VVASRRTGIDDPIEQPILNHAEQQARTVISHAHARDLAECWQDGARERHPITLLARTGEITVDAERSLAHDLQLLETASATWGSPPSIPEKQLRILLDYVRYHGARPPMDGWRELRDAEFLRSIRRMASEARAQAPATPEQPVLAPLDEYRGRRARRW
jgi:hypothetical protein